MTNSITQSSWHPYAPDQQFGRRVSADADLADALLGALEITREAPPRPGNKAEPAKPGASAQERGRP
jgi:hypothetical protein